jgi:hypothetical protein
MIEPIGFSAGVWADAAELARASAKANAGDAMVALEVKTEVMASIRYATGRRPRGPDQKEGLQHRCAPFHLLWPVSGLASVTASPSHA